MPIRIWFTDFWVDYGYNEPYFTPILKKYFNIEINPKPDILIHSVFGHQYLKYNCIRICYTGENRRPDFNKSDYHIGFDYIDDQRYLRWPYFLRRYNPDLLIQDKSIDNILSEKSGFCAFVFSNNRSKERIDFFNELSTYKKVDSGGKTLNNIGYHVADKIQFLRKYKFTIAFENSSYPGYTTEKICDAFAANSVPIYWRNELVHRDFNQKSFINMHNFNNTKELIEYITEIDKDTNHYKSMIQEPCFTNNTVPKSFHIDNLICFFDNIFSNIGTKKTVASFVDHLKYHFYIFNNNRIS